VVTLHYVTLQFILEYDTEAAISIYTNHCRTKQLRQVYICNKTVRVQGVTL